MASNTLSLAHSSLEQALYFTALLLSPILSASYTVYTQGITAASHHLHDAIIAALIHICDTVTVYSMAPSTATATAILAARNDITGPLPPFPHQYHGVEQPLHQLHLRYHLLMIASDPTRYDWRWDVKDREDFSDARSSNHRTASEWFDIKGDAEVRMKAEEEEEAETVELVNVDQMHFCKERGWVRLEVGEMLEVEEEEEEYEYEEEEEEYEEEEEEIEDEEEEFEEEEEDRDEINIGLQAESIHTFPPAKEPIRIALNHLDTKPESRSPLNVKPPRYSQDAPEAPIQATTTHIATPPQPQRQPRFLRDHNPTSSQPQQQDAHPTIELNEKFFVDSPMRQKLLETVLEQVEAGTRQPSLGCDQRDTYRDPKQPGASRWFDVPGEEMRQSGEAWPNQWRLDGTGLVGQAQAQPETEAEAEAELETNVQQAEIWDAETDDEEEDDNADEDKDADAHEDTKPTCDTRHKKKDSVISATFSSVLSPIEYKLVAPPGIPAHCVPTPLRSRREAFDVPNVVPEHGTVIYDAETDDEEAGEDGIERGLAASGPDVAAADDIGAAASEENLLRWKDEVTLSEQKAHEEMMLHKQARSEVAVAAQPTRDGSATPSAVQHELDNLVEEELDVPTPIAGYATPKCPATPPPRQQESHTLVAERCAPRRPPLTRDLRPAAPPSRTRTSRSRQGLKIVTQSAVGGAGPRASHHPPGILLSHHNPKDFKKRTSQPKVHFLETSISNESCSEGNYLEIQESKDEFRNRVLDFEVGWADCKRGEKMVKRMMSRRWRLWRHIRGQSDDD